MTDSPRRHSDSGWTTISRLRSLVLLCGAMLLLVSLTAVGSMQLQSENLRQLTMIQGPARDANDQVRQAMTDAQTGLNGYQQSGDRALLQPYLGSYVRTMTALATLQDTLALGAADGGEARGRRDLGIRQRLTAEGWWTNALRVEKALSRGERTDPLESRALFGRFLEVNTVLGERLSSALDQARVRTQSLGSRARAATIVAALVALLVMLLLGRQVAHSISRPLTALRDTMVREGEGDLGVRAREDKGSIETRCLAMKFNELTENNLALEQTQARALAANRIMFEIGSAIRAATDIQQVLGVICFELGERLGVDRVIGTAFRADDEVLRSAQWQRPDLPPLADLTKLADMEPMAGQMWRLNECRTRDDVPVAEPESPESVRSFFLVAGARASIMVPIGFGDRVIGMIHVLMISGPRAWDPSESDVVKVVAGYVARAIVEAANQAHQLEYVERVERLDRLKTDFLATVSHELRTPLTSISGYLELLQDEDAGKLTVQQHGMVNIIGRNTIRLRSLIEDVMMLNRIEDGVSRDTFVEVSIRALLIRVVDELRPLAESGGIGLELDAGPSASMAWGDRASLERAVLNILSNAIKFSHRGGVVTITGLLDDTTHRATIICQDRGLGIPEHDRAELFTRFFRASNATDQSIPGTGLGLSIAKQIVEDHHEGELRLISSEGEGTTVIIDLLLAESAQPCAPVGNDFQPSDVFGIQG